AAALGLVTLAGCTSAPVKDASSSPSSVAAAAGATKVKIAFVSGPLNDPFFPPLYQGAQDAAKQLPIELNYIPIDESDIQASSAKTMDAAIASKPDAIVVGDFITNVVDPKIQQAVAAGIPVFVNQSGQDSWEKVGALGFIGQFGPDVGAEAARRFAAKGQKNILCVVNVAGNPYLDAICKGLADGLSSQGGSSPVLTLPSGDGTDQAKTTRDISAFLLSHREIQGVMTLNNLTGYAAVDALKQAGKQNAPVGSLGVGKQALDAVKSGTMLFLVNEQPYLDGYLGTIMAYTYAKFGLAPVGVVKTGPQIVDSSNVDKIIQTFNKYPNVIGPK
ncbi:MAG: substrate-binding domain-containing protein, partial [Actinomycetales bacterium]